MTSSRATPTITIVVLNWNNAEDTTECLRSLLESGAPARDVLVVDNGSTDGSEEVLRRRFPDVPFIQTGKNLGYAGGNNVGIRRALASGADGVCILNNDIIVTPGFLEPLAAAVWQQPDNAAATPLVAEAGGACQVWALGLAVRSGSAAVDRRCAGKPIAEVQNRPVEEVDIASGSALVIRREVLERVGLFDEDFFLYYEEADWSLRAREAGFRILAVPSSLVWHKVSSTLGISSPRIDYYMTRNRLRFLARHWHGPQAWYLLAQTVLRETAAIAAYTVKPRGGQRLPHRTARLLALRDGLRQTWGPMGSDVEAVCNTANP